MFLSTAIVYGADPINVNTTISDRQAFALYIENDSRNIGGPGSDQAYSNGFKFSYIFAEKKSHLGRLLL